MQSEQDLIDTMIRANPLTNSSQLIVKPIKFILARASLPLLGPRAGRAWLSVGVDMADDRALEV